MGTALRNRLRAARAARAERPVALGDSGKVGDGRSTVRIVGSADVDERASIGDGSAIWHLAQVRENAYARPATASSAAAPMSARGCAIGDNCKIQNYALVYEPAVLEDGVFVGPAVVLTNDTFPRSVNPDRDAQARRPTGTPSASRLREGCSVGPGRSASRRSRSVAGRRWPPAQSSPETCQTSRWSRACPPGRSSGSAEPVFPWTRLGSDRWRCPETGEEYVEDRRAPDPTDEHGSAR